MHTSLPDPVLNYLRQIQIDPNLVRNPVNSQKILAKSLIVGKTHHQLIFLSNRFLDPQKVKRHLKLQDIPIQTIFDDKTYLCREPALPGFRGIIPIIDEAVLQQETLCLDLGNDEWLQLSSKAFKALIPLENVRPISSPMTLQGRPPIKNGEAIELSLNGITLTTNALPNVSPYLNEIIKLREDINLHTHLIVDIINRDPSMTAKLLSISLSSLYSRPASQKCSIEDAIVRVLGIEKTLNLVIALCINRSLKLKEVNPIDLANTWRNAMLVAELGERLVRLSGHSELDSETAYISGLLHNFGYLLLAELASEQYLELYKVCQINPHIQHSILELMTLNITTSEVAGSLLSHWGLPEVVLQAICHQHEKEKNLYSSLIFLVKYILHNHEYDQGLGLFLEPNVLKALYAFLEIDEGQAQNILSLFFDHEAEPITIISASLFQG